MNAATKFNKLEAMRKQNKTINQIKIKFSKELKMNDEEYLRDFKSKASMITKQLNNLHSGDGSSAVFNLNMYATLYIK